MAPLGFDMKIKGVSISRPGVPAAAVVELRNDDQGPFLDDGILDENESCQYGSGFIRIQRGVAS